MNVSLVTTLCDKSREVACIDMCRDMLLLGYGNGSIALSLWRPGLGWVTAHEVPRAHRYGTTATRFSPAGALVATVGVDGAARVWDARRGLAGLCTLVSPLPAAARCVLWAAACERLAVGYDDGAVRIWYTRSATLAAHVRLHEDAIRALCLLADEALLLTACSSEVLKVFNFIDLCDLGTEESKVPMPLYSKDGAHDLGVLCADSSDCGELAVTGGQDGRIRVWSLSGDGAARRVEEGPILCGHTAAVSDVRFTSELLVSASLDRTSRIWSPTQSTCIKVIHGHSRYLTCVAVSKPDALFLVTGSNDKTVRTWSMGKFNLDDQLNVTCSILSHFALGDLNGIGPVEVDEAIDTADMVGAGAEARLLWSARGAHGGAVNCVAVSERHLATCGSDGVVVVYNRCITDDGDGLKEQYRVLAHEYPALVVDIDRSGQLLVSAGLDGRALLYDVESGNELMSVSGESLACAGGGAGGGGVRCARLSPTWPTRILLATDDGLAAVWNVHVDHATQTHLFGVLEDGATCCAWAGDGRAVAVGGATGELRVFDPRPAEPRALITDALCQLSDAHDLGVLSCDFSPAVGHTSSEGDDRARYVLATGGRDAFIKLWTLSIAEHGQKLLASLTISRCVRAQCGGVHSVRWLQSEGAAGGAPGGAALASGGDDHWARVWTVEHEQGPNVQVHGVCAVSAQQGGAGGALSAALVSAQHLAVGTLDGSVNLWSLPPPRRHRTRPAHPLPLYWQCDDVIQWLCEYVTEYPGCCVSRVEAEQLCARVRRLAVTGRTLLARPDSPTDLLQLFGFVEAGAEDGGGGSDVEQSEPHSPAVKHGACARDRFLDELQWLRRRRGQQYQGQGGSAPHELLCGVTHRLLRDPVRLADGFTYDRLVLHELLLAQHLATTSLTEYAVSPMNGRRLVNASVSPNYQVREQLREYCGWRSERRRPCTCTCICTCTCPSTCTGTSTCTFPSTCTHSTGADASDTG